MPNCWGAEHPHPHPDMPTVSDQDVVTLGQRGNAASMSLPRKLLRLLTWNLGDKIMLRVVGEKLVAERVPMDKLGRVRTGEIEARQP